MFYKKYQSHKIGSMTTKQKNTAQELRATWEYVLKVSSQVSDYQRVSDSQSSL